MKVVAQADGLVRVGREGVRERLRFFWRRVSEAARFSPVRRSLLDRLLGSCSLQRSFGDHAFDGMTRSLSPYQLKPLNTSPLRDPGADTLEFQRVRACRAIRLFISATNVETHCVRLLDGETLTADMVMASACLPFLFCAVEIDGVLY
jgi:NTE family protein